MKKLTTPTLPTQPSQLTAASLAAVRGGAAYIKIGDIKGESRR